MGQAPYHLDEPRREAVLSAIKEVSNYRAWDLLAIHVRSTHVHAVVDAEDEPERILLDFKAYASRRLNEAGLDPPERKRWARHGSTRYLKTPRSISAAIEYVVAEQGNPMSALQQT